MTCEASSVGDGVSVGASAVGEVTGASVGGTAVGVLILGLIQTLITFKGDINSWWTRIVVGVLLLAFVLLQRVVVGASSGRGFFARPARRGFPVGPPAAARLSARNARPPEPMQTAESRGA